MMTPEDFQKKWEIGLTLPPAFHSAVEGKIVPWHIDPNWLTTLDSALETVPRRFIRQSRINVVIVVKGLKVGRRTAEAANSVYEPKWEARGARHLYPQRLAWVAIDRKLFDDPTVEDHLRVPFLDARLHEEVAHAWDFALEIDESPFCSIVDLPGSHWRSVVFLPDGSLAPFDIPNRKSLMDGYTVDELFAEDWASAVLWYIFCKEELHRRKSRPHHDFVEKLLHHEGILP